MSTSGSFPSSKRKSKADEFTASTVLDSSVSRGDVESCDSDVKQDGQESVNGANQHSLPNPEDAKMSESSSGLSSPLVGNSCIYLAIAVLLVAMTVGLGVGLTREKGGNASQGTSYSGFSAVTREKVKAAMRNYIVDNGVSSAGDFSDPDSPQSLALAFLGDTDELRLNAPLQGPETKEGYAFITRYAMSVFYYSMNGPLWNYDLLFVSKHETCDWYDVFAPPTGQIGVICNENTKDIVGISFINNNLSGSLPSELGALTTINYLETIGDRVEGSIPDSFSRLTSLRSVVLAYNSLSGSIPSWIDRWENLEFLYVSNNLLTGIIPDSFRNLQELSVLGLDDNNFSGSMDFMWALGKMEFAYLEDNQFTGRLPVSVFPRTPLLATLDLSMNRLSGELPSDLFQLNQLQILDLHGNDFTGSIPENPNSSAALSFLALHQNRLTSSIPASLGNMVNLEHLDLSENSLTGDFPQTLTNLNLLTYLFLAENNFNAGPIPT